MDFDLSECKHLILWPGIVSFSVLTSIKLYGTLIVRVEIWVLYKKKKKGKFWVGSRIIWIMVFLKDKLSFWIKNGLSPSQNRSQGDKAGTSYYCPEKEKQLDMNRSSQEWEMGRAGFYISVSRISFWIRWAVWKRNKSLTLAPRATGQKLGTVEKEHALVELSRVESRYEKFEKLIWPPNECLIGCWTDSVLVQDAWD